MGGNDGFLPRFPASQCLPGFDVIFNAQTGVITDLFRRVVSGSSQLIPNISGPPASSPFGQPRYKPIPGGTALLIGAKVTNKGNLAWFPRFNFYFHNIPYDRGLILFDLIVKRKFSGPPRSSRVFVEWLYGEEVGDKPVRVLKARQKASGVS